MSTVHCILKVFTSVPNQYFCAFTLFFFFSSLFNVKVTNTLSLFFSFQHRDIHDFNIFFLHLIHYFFHIYSLSHTHAHTYTRTRFSLSHTHTNTYTHYLSLLSLSFFLSFSLLFQSCLLKLKDTE